MLSVGKVSDRGRGTLPVGCPDILDGQTDRWWKIEYTALGYLPPPGRWSPDNFRRTGPPENFSPDYFPGGMRHFAHEEERRSSLPVPIANRDAEGTKL